MMHQLTYISTKRADDDELDTILAASRTNNRRDQITGLLISDGVRFLQALEGRKSLVHAAFDRISRDPRHRGIVTLSQRDVQCREFGHWEMASRPIARIDGEPDLVDLVDRLVAEVPEPNVRELFRSFARVRAAA